ncbi:decarboxylating 6-phosphogluconate dehydrogenase [Deinococcus rubellus]|uniref:Decarboxylating 6-phosphogluconate dehydrogenase n=1 Tax=Deinococcus rubellus TaxID=1889240 RepID=A0ABY5YKK8_9DEIO|nr:decarboxylating 6-phosphogluconate dehydrogenase [Deinococcus rubellus]UWX64882.1 decarboxylating 6-phosphogluconate dehydrogenase [Deinococcus rubellus]
MKIGMIGLGKMGGNMVARLLQGGQDVVAYDLSEDNITLAEGRGAEGARTIEELISKLPAPRAVWVMVPSGTATESTVMNLADKMQPGDIIIDGGNSNYKDSQRRAKTLAERGINFVDVGTSGGVWGLKEGYAMMVGGDKAAVESLTPILEVLAPAKNQGWGRMGPAGSGHYVKMVHNGIEYGMMQAYAEGFELMHAKTDMNLDMAQIAELWRYGSVIRSWLLDLTADALSGDPEFSDLSDYVADSGEGRWTVVDALNEGIPAPVITLSVQMRLRSQQKSSYAGKMLSAMRRAFGGHAVKKVETEAEETIVPEAHTPEAARPQNIPASGTKMDGDTARQLGESGKVPVNPNPEDTGNKGAGNQSEGQA